MNTLIEQITGSPLAGGWAADLLSALTILIIGVLVVTLVRIVASKAVKRESPVYSAFRRVVLPLLYAAAIYIALGSLPLPPLGEKILKGLAATVVTVLVIRTAVYGITGSVKRYVEKTGRVQDEKRIKPFLALVNFVLWIIGAIFLLDNLGFNISAVVAGLGVSGIAVAIAAQGILGDLFNYFVIFFDHPFELGDFIIFNDKLGTVEKIGIKTTRIRALSGEQLVVSNSDLTGSRVHNYKRMQERRVVFTIGVTYQTPAEQLESIPGLIREIIEANEETRFDRSHFRNYGDFALIFESVYYVLAPDYVKYMDIQQEINLAIYRTFEERGIEFAYPTSKVIVSREE
ncbi:MAG: mechanosensitive ion channel family protein [Spirochaetaceae bacterium]